MGYDYVPESGAFLTGAEPAATNTISVGSSGATPAQVQAALDESGLTETGAGVTVGVISDSFNDLGGAAADEADGLLPPAADIDVLEDYSQKGGTDEGRAMIQIVHDIAPGARLDFYTADESEQDYADGILKLANAGCKIIVTDVQYFDEPFFQNGIVAQAVEAVEAEGVTFVAAAGNDGEEGYQAAWSPLSTTYDGVALTGAESFSGGPVQTVTASSSDSAIDLQWNASYQTGDTSLNVIVFQNGSLAPASGYYISQGAKYDDQIYFNSPGTYQIAIEDASGPNPGLIKEIGYETTIEGANTGTVFGSPMTPGAIAVGAAATAETPAAGVNPPQSESFSSSGEGSELLFSDDGTPLATPDTLKPVSVTGVDDIDTSVFAPFYGTSAAAPSVAAVAALMLQANPKLTPAGVGKILAATADSMSSSEVSGAGLVDADAAVAMAIGFAVCYVAGTRILTSTGEKPVETLAAGDFVVTASGEAEAIRWIGHREIDCSAHPEPGTVWPVRIAAGAIAPGVPKRDLRVSPGHSLFFDGVLVPADYLVNGTTIVQEPVDRVSYWHVELDRHDLLLAEGMAAESYLDDGNRAFFANGGAVTALRPSVTAKERGDAIWAELGCAPRCLDGPRLDQLRARLGVRADYLGARTTADPDLRLCADGEMLFPASRADGVFRFEVPAGTRRLRLLSRSFVPSQDHRVKTVDDRRLGVRVFQMRVDGEIIVPGDIRLTDGWHDVEAAAPRPWRWTKGDAALPVGVAVTIEIAAARYPLPWRRAAASGLSGSSPSPRRAIA